MASGNTHVKFYRLAGLNEEQSARLQAWIDAPSKIMGARHRVINHSTNDLLPFLFSRMSAGEDPKPYVAAWATHMLLDSIGRAKDVDGMVHFLELLQAR